MPSLRLLLNIGLPDARRLGLAAVRAGEVVDASADAAVELIARGWAVLVDASKHHGRPATDAGDQGPDLGTMTKLDLLAHAKALGLAGLAVTSSKADILRAIEEAGDR